MTPKPKTITCPHCGHAFPLPFRPVESQIAQAVEKITRHSGAASSQAVALEVSLSKAQTVRYLNRLERNGTVQRIGQRKGWRAA